MSNYNPGGTGFISRLAPDGTVQGARVGHGPQRPDRPGGRAATPCSWWSATGWRRSTSTGRWPAAAPARRRPAQRPRGRALRHGLRLGLPAQRRLPPGGGGAAGGGLAAGRAERPPGRRRPAPGRQPQRRQPGGARPRHGRPTAIVDLGASLLDGLRPDGAGGYLVSDYRGRVLRVSLTGRSRGPGRRPRGRSALRRPRVRPGARLLVVPSFAGDTVTAYEVGAGR